MLGVSKTSSGWILLPLVAIALVSLLVVSGCGDSANSEDQALTKKQFVRLTQAQCHRGYLKQEKVMKEFADRHGLLFGGGEPWEQEVINAGVVYDFVRKRIAYWKSLQPEESYEKEVRQVIKAMEKGLETTEKEPAALAEPRPGKQPLPEPFTLNRHRTADFGPWLCGQA
jgi:hypothetical protein